MANTLFNIEPPPQGTFSKKDAQAAPIYVNNATVLGYSQEVQYFGGDIGFKKTVSLDIRCVVTDITNQSGASVASKNLMEFLNDSQDYSEVILNGRQLGPAKVVGFSVDSADMVNSASCSVSFLIHETYDDLSALSSNTYYADYADSLTFLTISDFGQILDSFTDSISLSRGNNETSYSRNISISANKSLNIQKLGDVIKEFVRGVLAFGTFSFPDFSGTEADIKELADPANNFKKFMTETVDDTSNSYTFQESLTAGNIQDDYSLVVSNTYSRAQNGIEYVSENGSIIGLTDPRINAAEVGYAAELENADARMKAFYLERRLSPTCPDLNTDKDSGNLIFFTKGKTTDTFEGTISYTLASNNDPSYKDGSGEKWDYTITLDSDGVYETATEQGTINGRGHVKYDGNKTGLKRYTKYQTAKDFFEALDPGILRDMNDRITPLINADHFDVSPKPTRRTESHAPRQGVITYSRSFSNHPSYQKNGASDLIKKLTASSTLNSTIPITHEYVALAPRVERKIVQEQSTESLSTVSSTITAVSYRILPSDGKNQLSRIGNIAKDEIDLVAAMDGDTDYMGAAGFSFSSLNDVIFTLNTSYNGGIGSC